MQSQLRSNNQAPPWRAKDHPPIEVGNRSLRVNWGTGGQEEQPAFPTVLATSFQYYPRKHIKVISCAPGTPALFGPDEQESLSLQQGYLLLAHAQGPKQGSWSYAPTPPLSASKLENPDPELGPLQGGSVTSNHRFAPALPPIGCPQAQLQPPQPRLCLWLGTRGVERKAALKSREAP